jgi:hypothetical protein
MARVYAGAKFSVTGVTALCDNKLGVLLRNIVASRAGNPRRTLRLAQRARTPSRPFAGSERRAHSRGGQKSCHAVTALWRNNLSVTVIQSDRHGILIMM